jgi:four helix bundle protein
LADSWQRVQRNYRSACTARSRRDFIAKLAIVVEESDESVYWLDLIIRSQSAAAPSAADLRSEATELRAIFSRSLGTARANSRIVPEMTR